MEICKAHTSVTRGSNRCALKHNITHKLIYIEMEDVISSLTLTLTVAVFISAQKKKRKKILLVRRSDRTFIAITKQNTNKNRQSK